MLMAAFPKYVGAFVTDIGFLFLLPFRLPLGKEKLTICCNIIQRFICYLCDHLNCLPITIFIKRHPRWNFEICTLYGSGDITSTLSFPFFTHYFEDEIEKPRRAKATKSQGQFSREPITFCWISNVNWPLWSSFKNLAAPSKTYLTLVLA